MVNQLYINVFKRFLYVHRYGYVFLARQRRAVRMIMRYYRADRIAVYNGFNHLSCRNTDLVYIT